jgi:ABC-2 type transport system ATP-binding protein
MAAITDLAIKTDNLGRVYKVRDPQAQGPLARLRRRLRGNGATPAPPKELVALAGVSLEVPRGEFFGLLGPNGAGKTTLIKILTTLLAPTTGRAWVAGYDVYTQPQQVRPRINMVSGGESSGYGLLTVRENLWMFGQFYGLDTRTAHKRIDALLAVVGLADRANTKTSDLSTGLRQKMNIVRGFLTDPEVIFLDEPTLGLDVGASRDVRAFVRAWMNERPGRTLLLTTHYMAEADELCDRVAIINRGRVLANDSPANLKRALQQETFYHLDVSPIANGSAGAVSALEALPGVRQAVHSLDDGQSALEVTLAGDDALGGVMTTLSQHGVTLRNLSKREPTLEDVFVDLVGTSMAEAEKESR